MDACIEMLKRVEILGFYSQNIFSLLLYVVNNKKVFTKNSDVHQNNIRSANIFHLLFTNLTKYKKELLKKELKFLIIFLHIIILYQMK
jgi:hypothetical protein